MATGVSASGVPYRSGIVSIIGHCNECGLEIQTLNGQGLAAQHAKATGHTISIEVVNAIIYNPKG